MINFEENKIKVLKGLQMSEHNSSLIYVSIAL